MINDTMNQYRTTAYIDLNTLEENYNKIKAQLPTDTKILCVVKADAYGHGMIRIAEKLQSINADFLGVATVSEGISLRAGGINLPVLVMSGIMPWEDAEPVLSADLTPVVYSFDALEKLRNMCSGKSKNINIHLKIDTGMGRLGFNPDTISDIVQVLKGSKRIAVEGLMSHFAASEMRDEHGIEQIRVFNNILQALRNDGIRPELTHMANSGAITNYPEAYFNMVRVGVNLYGSYTAMELKERLTVRPIMKLTSRISLLKEFAPGCPLSYGRTYITKKHMRIAYIPVGYADGYPRSLSNKGSVLIRDRRCSIVGRVCMDWILVDVTDVKDICVSEEVILLGRGKADAITADEIALLAGTIPYEILCKISSRIPRVYV